MIVHRCGIVRTDDGERVAPAQLVVGPGLSCAVFLLADHGREVGLVRKIPVHDLLNLSILGRINLQTAGVEKGGRFLLGVSLCLKIVEKLGNQLVHEVGELGLLGNLVGGCIVAKALINRVGVGNRLIVLIRRAEACI